MKIICGDILLEENLLSTFSTFKVFSNIKNRYSVCNFINLFYECKQWYLKDNIKQFGKETMYLAVYIKIKLYAGKLILISNPLLPNMTNAYWGVRKRCKINSLFFVYTRS